MATYSGRCTNCEAKILVDDTYQTGLCEYCGRNYCVEQAINLYALENPDMNEVHIGGVIVTKEIGSRILELVESKNYMEAVKILRETAELDLKSAKDAVDLYSKNLVVKKKPKIKLFAFLRK